MAPILSQILAGVIIAIFVALITYFVTTKSQTSVIESVTHSAFKQHAQVYHQRSISEVLQISEEKLSKKFEKELKRESDRIDKLEVVCKSIESSLVHIRISQAFLVASNGGNPKDYGLDES